jgi:uncharacterized protein (DUF305 family)
MKRNILFTGFTVFVLACNNPSTNHEPGQDSASHGSHEATTEPGSTKQHNAVTAGMQKMMRDMHAIENTGNNDIDFAVMMMQHHRGAVEMARVEVSQGNDAALKAFAQKVIDDQNQEISFMQEFIAKASKGASPDAAAFQKALMQSMMVMMNDKTRIYNKADQDFAAQMIPHHQSAVEMAEVYLQYGKNAGLIKLSQNIVESQRKEIAWLKEWLARTG